VVDLGGVDTAAFRRRPDRGDPTYAAYQFRESFGARWVEMTGAHRTAMHPARGSVGRVAAAALRRLCRLAPRRLPRPGSSAAIPRPGTRSSPARSWGTSSS